MKKVVIVGGGFAGAEVAAEVSKDKEADVLLISRANYLTYTPFLADVAGGTIAVVHAVPPLRLMAPKARVEVAGIAALDVAGRRVRLRRPDGTDAERPYDYLAIALGAQTNFRHGAGSEQYGFPLLEVGDAFILRNHVLEMLELAEASADPDERRELLTFVFAGGGFSGVEGAAAIKDLVHGSLRYFKTIGRDEPRFILAPHGTRLLAQIDEKLGQYVVRQLDKRAIDVRLGVGVERVTPRTATLTTGEVIPTRTVLWAAGIDVDPVVRASDLPKTAHGALRVGSTLQVEGHDSIFALGDCAAVPTPDGKGYYAPTAQNAIREGRTAAANIRALIHGRRPEHVFDYKPIGSLASLGHRRAVAQIKGVKLSGLPAWFMWRGIYLMKMPGLSRKFQVAVDWIGDVFMPVETTYFPLAWAREKQDRRTSAERRRAG